MDRFNALQAFVAVAETGSFTAAAEKLDSSNQLLSKYVAQLEAHLQVRLLNRTTRKVNLTEAGQQCLPQAQQLLMNMAELEGRLGQLQEEVSGRLMISAPVSFAHLHLAKLISEFKQRYPQVTINLQVNDRKVDVLDEGFDLALRIGQLKSSSLIAKKIAPIRLALCASPTYFAEHGIPQTPADLIGQHYLHYSYLDLPATEQPLLARLRQFQQAGLVKLEANNGEVLMANAIADQGFMLQPTFIVGQALKQGLLREVLADYVPAPLGLYAVYPHRNYMAPKLRAFIDFLADYFTEQPAWD